VQKYKNLLTRQSFLGRIEAESLKMTFYDKRAKGKQKKRAADIAPFIGWSAFSSSSKK
jgi:hypothetical protein